MWVKENKRSGPDFGVQDKRIVLIALELKGEEYKVTEEYKPVYQAKREDPTQQVVHKVSVTYGHRAQRHHRASWLYMAPMALSPRLEAEVQCCVVLYVQENIESSRYNINPWQSSRISRDGVPVEQQFLSHIYMFQATRTMR